MARTYVLQAPRIAVAAARMKADVNYIGVQDEETVAWLQANHVFVRDVWRDGHITVRRLQRLYHQLFPGDVLMMDGSLPENTMRKAISYAQAQGARIVVCLEAGQTVADTIIPMTDVLICYQAGFDPVADNIIVLDEALSSVAWAGALALCLMNGQNRERFEPFCYQAASMGELPWYDEVAYH